MTSIVDINVVQTILTQLSSWVLKDKDVLQDVRLIADMDMSWNAKQELLYNYLIDTARVPAAEASEVAGEVLVVAGLPLDSIVLSEPVDIDKSTIGWILADSSKVSDRAAETIIQRVWGGYRSVIDGSLLQDPDLHALSRVLDGDKMLADVVDDLIDDIFPVAKSTGIRWARVPDAGACDFCMMLATRGAVYLTRESAVGKGGYHSNCRCLPVPSNEYVISDRAKKFDWVAAGF